MGSRKVGAMQRDGSAKVPVDRTAVVCLHAEVTAMRYDIGGEVFTSKTAIEARCRAILGPQNARREYTIEEQDLEFVRGLFERHPEARRKTDVRGPKSFRVVASTLGTHCLAVGRSDGTWERWSYSSAITPPTPWARFVDVARRVIAPQILAFRDAHPERVSAVSGVAIDGTGHVDHAAPWTFDALLRAFVVAYAVDVDAVVYVDRADGFTWWEDDALSRAWEEYHREIAVLRLVTAEENLRLLRPRAA